MPQAQLMFPFADSPDLLNLRLPRSNAEFVTPLYALDMAGLLADNMESLQVGFRVNMESLQVGFRVNMSACASDPS